MRQPQDEIHFVTKLNSPKKILLKKGYELQLKGSFVRLALQRMLEKALQALLTWHLAEISIELEKVMHWIFMPPSVTNYVTLWCNFDRHV